MSHSQPFARVPCRTSGGHRRRHTHRFSLPTRSRSRGPTGTSRRPPAAARVRHAFHSQPFARAHCRTSGWPRAASVHVRSFPRSRSRGPTVECRGGPCGRFRRYLRPTRSRSRGPCRTSKWPPYAAMAQVLSSHSQPFARAHCRISGWPPRATSAQVLAFHGQPFSRAHRKRLRWPPAAASAQVHSSHRSNHSSRAQSSLRVHCNACRLPALATACDVSSPIVAASMVRRDPVTWPTRGDWLNLQWQRPACETCQTVDGSCL